MLRHSFSDVCCGQWGPYFWSSGAAAHAAPPSGFGFGDSVGVLNSSPSASHWQCSISAQPFSQSSLAHSSAYFVSPGAARQDIFLNVSPSFSHWQWGLMRRHSFSDVCFGQWGPYFLSSGAAAHVAPPGLGEGEGAGVFDGVHFPHSWHTFAATAPVFLSLSLSQ